MDVSLAIVTLRFLARFAVQLGHPKEATGLNNLASAARAGINVDQHMKLIADNMEAGNPIPWDQVELDIRNNSDRLHGRTGKPQPAPQADESLSAAEATNATDGSDPERTVTGVATETIHTRRG